jgi:hypothetical protein
METKEIGEGFKNIADRTDDEIIDFVQCFFNFYPYKYQKIFLATCVKEKRIAALWSRQSGKSTCISNYVLYACLTNNRFTVIIVAPTQRQSSELYLKIRNNISTAPIFSNYVESSTQTELRFTNGSRIVSLPSGPDGGSIKGFTANIVILEECGMMKDKIVNEVVLPMIASTNGQVIKIGTPKGKNNFWQSCYGKETKYKLFYVPYNLPLSEGQYNQEFIDEQRNNLTELEFQTEYEAKFIEDTDCYFKQMLIESCLADYELWYDDCTCYSILPKWCQFYCGVDFARMGEDVTVITILEKRDGCLRVIYTEEIKHKKLTEAIGRIKQLDGIFNFMKICLDETGIGAGPTDMLEEELGNKIQGITFTVKSKEDMYSNLKKMMEQGRVKFPMIKKLFYEMSDLRYEISGSGNTKIHHSEGGHDDYPDALALACWACKEDDYVLTGRHIF